MMQPLSQILSLLRDQSWSFGGIIVAIVLYLVDQMRHNHEIAYEVTSVEDIVDKVNPNLSISKRIVLKIWNCGNESIFPAHYGYPIEFSIG